MKKLEFDMKYFRGAVTPGVRMNKKLQDYYFKNELWKIRANCPSGIQIAFTTDATGLQIEMQFAEKARDIFTCDVLADAGLTTFDGPGTHSLSLPEGQKNIIIHMPHLAVPAQFDVFVNDSACINELPPPPRKMLLCGDSIMQGMTSTTPSRAVGPQLAEKLNCQLHNTSVGGVVMHPTQVKESLALGGDIILTALGINDSGGRTDPELFRRRTREALLLLSNFAGKAFIQTPLPCICEAETRRELYSRIIREEQKNFPAVTLFEGSNILPADASLFVDGLHPNDTGMKLYAEKLALLLRQAGC